MKNAWGLQRPLDDKQGAWSGFCEVGWTTCPDAIANEDYYWYAKALGKEYVRTVGDDGEAYCRLNGFTSPEMLALTRDFKAMQAKAQELCDTKYKKYKWDKMTINSIALAPAMKTRVGAEWHMSVKAAEYKAAHTCAMGGLACDITMCNYGYCPKNETALNRIVEKPPAGTTTAQEQNGCAGWTEKHGMP